MWANHFSSLFLSFICRMRIARPLLKITMWCTNENHYIRIRYCCYYYYHLDIINIAILLEYWSAVFIGHICCTTEHLALCQTNILLSVTVFTIKVKAETYSNERIYAAFMGHCLALIHSTRTTVSVFTRQKGCHHLKYQHAFRQYPRADRRYPTERSIYLILKAKLAANMA